MQQLFAARFTADFGITRKSALSASVDSCIESIQKSMYTVNELGPLRCLYWLRVRGRDVAMARGSTTLAAYMSCDACNYR